MTTTIIPVADFDMVVFGATGDLTLRKLLPALYHRFADKQFSTKCRIIAAARSDLTDDSYRERADKALREHVAAADLADEMLGQFLTLIVYARVDGSKATGWERLDELLAGAVDRIRVFYLATSPDLYGAVCRNLQQQGLVTERSRVVLEKPIGHDLASARQIIDDVGHVFSERQTYRIDLRAALECGRDRPCADYGRRDGGRGEPWRLLRSLWCVARHGSEPSAATDVLACDGAADQPGCRCVAR